MLQKDRDQTPSSISTDNDILIIWNYSLISNKNLPSQGIKSCYIFLYSFCTQAKNYIDNLTAVPSMTELICWHWSWLLVWPSYILKYEVFRSLPTEQMCNCMPCWNLDASCTDISLCKCRFCWVFFCIHSTAFYFPCYSFWSFSQSWLILTKLGHFFLVSKAPSHNSTFLTHH